MATIISLLERDSRRATLTAAPAPSHESRADGQGGAILPAMRGAAWNARNGQRARAPSLASPAVPIWLLALLVPAAELGCSSRDSVGQHPTGGAAGMAAAGGSGGRSGAGAAGGSVGTAGVTGAAGGPGAAGSPGAAGGNAGTSPDRNDTGGTAGGGRGGETSAGQKGGSSASAGAGGGGAGGAALGAGGASMTTDLSGGVDWEPWPAVDPAPANSCAVAWFIGGDKST